MNQSKKQSLTEAITNTFIGFIISLAASFIIFPLFGIKTSVLDNIGITIFYTVISILRTYIIRRFFNNKLVTYVGPKTPFNIFCFACEVETQVIQKKNNFYCDNCGLKH
jgi:hypothetical protein